MDDQGIRKDPLPTPDPIGLMWLKEFEATAWRTMDKVVRMKKANDRETALIFEAMQSFMREIRVSVACADIRLMDGLTLKTGGPTGWPAPTKEEETLDH